MLAARVHVPPLFERVTVTVEPDVLAERAQFANPVTGITVGFAGTVKAELKTAVTESPWPRAPVDEVVKPTVQVAGVEFALCGDPANVTPLTSEIAIGDDGLPFPVSSAVETVKVLAA